MPLSWFTDSITRIRPGTKTERGSIVPDWENATEEVIDGCSVQPATTSLSQDGRVLGISESFNLYMPEGADIQKGDRVVFDDDTYTVIGVPKKWRSPTGRLNNVQATMERWSG